MSTERGGLEYVTTRLSLKELATRLASPLTEEHAWAILHQLAQKFARQLGFASGSCSRQKTKEGSQAPGSIRLSLDGVALLEDGEVYLEESKFKPCDSGE